jgi:hypothetical protein
MNPCRRCFFALGSRALNSYAFPDAAVVLERNDTSQPLQTLAATKW